MLRIFHFLAALAVGIAALGCGLQSSESTSQNDPLTLAKQEVVQERARAIQTHHDRIVEEFVKAEGMGVRRMPVLSHNLNPASLAILLPGWTEEPALDATGSVPPTTLTPWFVERVELVSLLVNDKPAVYPTTGGRLFGRQKTRDLDDFETTALEKLRNGEQLAVKESPENVRVLGAIRMRKECQACHDKPAGTLLGAFAYSIRPGLPKAAPAPEKEPESDLKKLLAP